jgi:hypothetical protein
MIRLQIGGKVVSVSIAGTSSKEIDQVAYKLANEFELYKWILGSRILKEPVSVADRLDWQIIQGLRYNALLTVKELSELLSITPRMVEYRTNKP